MFERVWKGLSLQLYLFHALQSKKCEDKGYQYQSVQRFTEAVAQRCSVKKVFLEISQNSEENTCARISLLIKLQTFRPATSLKEILWHRCFLMNFAKFLRTPFFTEHLWWLLLDLSGNALSQTYPWFWLLTTLTKISAKYNNLPKTSLD